MSIKAVGLSVLASSLLFNAHAQNLQLDRRNSAIIENNTIRISVRNDQNAPTADARVEIQDQGTRQAVASGYTDVSGFLELRRIENGLYEVVVTKGLSQSGERAEVRNGDLELNVRLSESGTENGASGPTVSVSQYKVPGKARDEYRKGLDAMNHRKLEDAEKHIEHALEIYPKYAEALTIRGVLKLDRRALDLATEDFQQAIQFDPGCATAYFGLGAVYNATSQFDEALKALDRGIALNPMSWQGYFEMGKAQIGKGNYPLAIRSLDKAESLAADKFPLIHLMKANALLAMRAYPDAMTEIQGFLNQSPGAAESETARKMLQQVQAFTARR